jgi:hypothetical protein
VFLDRKMGKKVFTKETFEKQVPGKKAPKKCP